MTEDRGPSPELGGPSDTFEIERASATPLTRGPRLVREPDAHFEAAKTSEVHGPLPELLSWFSAVVMHPENAAQGVKLERARAHNLGANELEDVVTAGPRLSALERLELYQYSYFARLVECLADDYPAIKYALGESGFDRLARRYIQANPSRSPNLNRYGKNFGPFVHEQRDLEHRVFLADLARLEWAMVEVLHARGAETFSMSMLQEVPPELWASIRFVPAETLRFEVFEYPINRFVQAFRRDQQPTIPVAEWAATAIYRKGYTIWRMDFTRPMAEVLEALLRGETLGDALGLLADAEDERLATDVMVWFREWVSGSFFERIVLPDEPTA